MSFSMLGMFWDVAGDAGGTFPRKKTKETSKGRFSEPGKISFPSMKLVGLKRFVSGLPLCPEPLHPDPEAKALRQKPLFQWT